MSSERRSYAERARTYAETLQKRFEAGVLKRMQDKPLWSLWKAEIDEQGKSHKRPYSPRGYPLSTNKPEQWSSLATVLEALATARFPVSGIGVLLVEPYILLDLDAKDSQMYDRQANQLVSQVAQRLLQQVPSYAELSPHNGVHILTEGTLRRGNVKTPQLEMYTNWFSTVTTKHLPGTPLDVTNQQHALEALEDEFHPFVAQSPVQNTGGGEASSRLAALPPEAAHDRLLQELLQGDMKSIGNDHHRADWLLLMKLLHWTGDDRQLAKAIFLASPLGQRAKAQDETGEGRRGNTSYVEKTIDRILEKRWNPPMKR